LAWNLRGSTPAPRLTRRAAPRQAAAARLASGQASQEDALTEQMAALLAETRGEGSGRGGAAGQRSPPRRSPRVSRSDADGGSGGASSPQARTPRNSSGGGGGRAPRAVGPAGPPSSAHAGTQAGAGDAPLSTGDNRKVILHALRLALGRALHRDAAADSAAAEAEAAGDASSGDSDRDGDDSGDDSPGGAAAGGCCCDEAEGDVAEAGGATVLVSASELMPRAADMTAVLTQLERWVQQQKVREAALAQLAEAEALRLSRADFAEAAQAAVAARDALGGVASDSDAGCGCSGSAWLRRAPGVKLARRLQAGLASAVAALDAGSRPGPGMGLADAPICFAAIECSRFHVVFCCDAHGAALGLPPQQLLGWSEGASLHPDDSRDLADMVTRLPDFVPPAGRSPPWDVLRRRHANGRWARMRRLCGILALVGPDDGGDPRTGGSLVGLQIETPLPPAGVPDPVPAARRSALAAAAFSACEVLMAELRREWQAAMAEDASGGGSGGAIDTFNSTVNACVASSAGDLGAPVSGGPPSRGSSGGALSVGGRDRETVSWLNDVILGGAAASLREHEQQEAAKAASKAMPPAE